MIRRLPAAGVMAVAGILALWLTTDDWLIRIDWDNAAHYDGMRRMLTHQGGQCGYGRTLWTCGYTAHMALVPIYGVGTKVAGIFGGDAFTGLRLVNGFAVAGAAGLLVSFVRRLGGGAVLGIAIAGAFLFSPSVLFLVRTVEDDGLSLFWMAAILYFCLRDGRRFTPAAAVAGGALVATAALTNYSLIAWLPVVLAAATIYVRPELPTWDWHRLQLPALVVVGFCGTVGLYGLWLNVSDSASWPWSTYREVLTASPNELVSQPGNLGKFLDYVAGRPLAVALRGFPTDWLLEGSVRPRVVAMLLLGVTAAGAVWPLRHGPSGLSLRGRAVSLSCLALLVCTAPAAWKNDVTYFERMSHVPLCLLTILAAISAGSGAAKWPPAVARNAGPALAGFFFVVGAVWLGTASRTDSWLEQFRTVRHQQPAADTFVYAESELIGGDYDQLVSLSLALDNVIVLTGTGQAQAWPVRPFTVLSVDDFRRSPPEHPFLTDGARALVEGP